MKKFTADFETVTWLKNKTYVWAWATCEIGNEDNLKIDNNIDSFIDYCKKEKNSTWFFHNLKFDGEFLISWALNNGFKHIQKKEDIGKNTFSTVISDMGEFYKIEFYFDKGNKTIKKATFIDSLKIIPFSVDDTAKSFKLPISKLKIDYNKPRKKGHILTQEEKEYIKNDVVIMAKALKVIFDEGLTKMTRASNALADYKKIMNSMSKFEHYFPQLDKMLDEEIRKSYKGGFTYLNPNYIEKQLENIVNLDVNSLYPYVMYSCKMPIGNPIYYEGKYKNDKIYDLYIQTIECEFEIKKNKIPTIQIKKNLSFIPNEYLISSNGEIVSLTLTSVDLELFLEQYNVKYIKYIKGWKFKSCDTLFKDYIDKWINRKIEAGKEGNAGQRQLAKLMLNSLYGKFAMSLEMQNKIPYLGEDEIVHYKKSDKEERKGLYLPVGCFVTAWARNLTIRTAQKITDYSIEKYGQDMFIYSDTDSIKTLLSIEELQKICNIDDFELGAWKNEGIATKGKFIRQKTYLEEIDGKIHITCAGLPKTCYDKVNFDNFKIGFSCGEKLTFKHVIGGVKLVETEFTIKERKIKKDIADFSKK